MRIRNLKHEIIGASIFDKARNFAQAINREIQAGGKLADKTERLRRMRLCNQCPRWNESGNLLLGECMHPECGCTKFKRFFVSEHCPEGKW